MGILTFRSSLPSVSPAFEQAASAGVKASSFVLYWFTIRRACKV